ncbi:hypothetical protein DFH06DRAFT_195489 [Mycena polygramma]|nr:hypothetical protein DFH06DRAFT_195489 [Mycena polygramma]
MLPGTLVAIITHYALPTRAFPLSFLVYGAKTTPNLCMQAVRCPGCGDDAARYTCHCRPHHARRVVEVSMCPRLGELSRWRRRLRARLAQSRACSAPALTPSCARDDSLAFASRTAYATATSRLDTPYLLCTPPVLLFLLPHAPPHPHRPLPLRIYTSPAHLDRPSAQHRRRSREQQRRCCGLEEGKGTPPQREPYSSRIESNEYTS